MTAASTLLTGITLNSTAISALARSTSAPASQAGGYKEAPALADLVKAGKLPPVEQRLPVSPRVITPLERVGQYGGTWHRAYSGLSDRVGPAKLHEAYVIRWDAPNPSTLGLAANVVDSFQINDDASEYTFHLREGMKWSDGHDVTTDDVRFWYEDYQLVPDIIPTPSNAIRQIVNGESRIAQLDVLDPYTFKVTFPAPNPLLPLYLAKSGGGLVAGPAYLAPAHYLKQFHPKYADVNKLNAMAADKKLPGWQALWGTAGDQQGPANFWFINPDLPILNAWRTTVPAPGDPHVMERNPYFYWVDTDGNQLPYIDKVEHALYQNSEVLNLWVAQGKIDEQGRGMSAASYTFYKENEAKGAYKVYRWRSASTESYFPNQNSDNPMLRQLFGAPEFRKALNISINREEINQVLYNGLGRARQAAPVNGSPEYDPDFETRWTEYDPDTANALLDNMGLARGADGIRTMPDGTPIEWVVEHTSLPGSPGNDQHEFVRRAWEAIGLRVTMNYVERSLYQQHVNNGDIDMGYWGYDRLSVIKADPGRWTGVIQDGPWAPRWGNFYNNAPYKKEEPPAGHPIRQVWSLWEKTQQTPDEATRNSYFQQLLDIHKAAPFVVGVVGELVSPFIVKSNFRNFGDGYIADDTLRDDGLLNPPHFFFERS